MMAPAQAVAEKGQEAQAVSSSNQSDAPEIVIVTARRVSEDLQEVPLTVLVLDREALIRQAVRGINDVARLTAGLTYDLGGFPNDTRPALRGMQAERGRPSVAVMIDTLDLSSENLAIAGGTAGVTSSVLDLERIEIVKGPQSTLYGRNAFGGAINYISRKPSFESEFRASLDLGSTGFGEVTGSASGPLIDQRLAYRLNVVVRGQDGLYTNPINFGDLGGEAFVGGAFALRATPYEGLDITARVQRTSTDASDLATAFLPSTVRLPVPGGTFTAAPPGTPAQNCPAILTGQPNSVVTSCTRGTLLGPIRATVADVQTSTNPLTDKPMSGMDMSQTLATLDGRWTAGFGTFQYLFGWIENESRIENDGDFTSFPAPPGFVFSLSALQDLTYTNEHTDHTLMWYHTLGPVDLLLGGQIFDEHSTLLNDSKFWLRSPTSPLAGPPFFLPTSPAINPYPAFFTRDTSYRALFGRVRWNVTDTVRLGIEARQNEDKISYTLPGWRLQDTSLSRLRPVCLAGTPQGATFAGAPGPLVPPPGTVQACPRTETVKFSQLTPRLTLDWQVTGDAMVYFSAARGYKPGGFNVNEVTEFTDQGYLPEFVDAFELGIKTQWFQRRLTVNADLYRNSYTDQQIGVQRNQVGANNTVIVASGIINAASVKTNGFEIDADWQVNRALRLNLGYANTQAVFDEYVQGPRPGSTAAEFAACGVPNGQSSSDQVRAEAGNACADFSNRNVAKSPEHSLNLSAIYTGAFGPHGDSWFAELSGLYRSKRYVDEANLSWMPGYTVIDFTGVIILQNVTFTGYVRNITDDDTIRMAQRQIDQGRPEGFAPGRGIVAYLPPPRSIGVRVVLRL